MSYLIIRGGLSRQAACALVALFSILFLYHRDYDTVILVLPLVYGACQARAASARGHRRFTAIGLLVIAILYLNAVLLRPLAKSTGDWGLFGRLMQATVLPYATWLILLAMFVLVWATRPATTGADETNRLTTVHEC